MTHRSGVLGLAKAPTDTSLAAIGSALSVIEDEIATLTRRVGLLESQWSGEAQDAFRQAMRECERSLSDLHRLADRLNRVATVSVTRLDEFDRRRASAWNR
jgi:WXG100 family type VII secretion target